MPTIFFLSGSFWNHDNLKRLTQKTIVLVCLFNWCVLLHYVLYYCIKVLPKCWIIVHVTNFWCGKNFENSALAITDTSKTFKLMCFEGKARPYYDFKLFFFMILWNKYLSLKYQNFATFYCINAFESCVHLALWERIWRFSSPTLQYDLERPN